MIGLPPSSAVAFVAFGGDGRLTEGVARGDGTPRSSPQRKAARRIFPPCTLPRGTRMACRVLLEMEHRAIMMHIVVAAGWLEDAEPAKR